MLDAITQQEVDAYQREHDYDPDTAVLETDQILGKVDPTAQRLMVLKRALEIDLQYATSVQSDAMFGGVLGFIVVQSGPAMDQIKTINILGHCTKAIAEFTSAAVTSSVDDMASYEGIRIAREWQIVGMDEEAVLRRRLHTIEQEKQQVSQAER